MNYMVIPVLCGVNPVIILRPQFLIEYIVNNWVIDYCEIIFLTYILSDWEEGAYNEQLKGESAACMPAVNFHIYPAVSRSGDTGIV